MAVMVYPNFIKGNIKAVDSKTLGHRVLMGACLSDKETVIELKELSLDLLSTMECLEALGASFVRKEASIIVSPIKDPPVSALLNVGESGSTLRFLLPLAAVLTKEAEFRGTGKLPERPVVDLIQEMTKNGCIFSSKKLPFTVGGTLKPGKYSVPGNVTSQYLTGLLFALPLLEKDSLIEIKGPLESMGYVEITLSVLKEFNIEVEKTKRGYKIKGNQKFKSPGTLEVEGDWSNAAFFMAMGALNGDVTIEGLREDSLQPDRAFLNILKSMGADTAFKDRSLHIKKSQLLGVDVDVSQCPDLLPVLALVMAQAKGDSRIYGGKRVRLKESDRISTIAKNLKELGIHVIEEEDGILIKGADSFKGGAVMGENDHRIVMAMTTASVKSISPILITDEEAVNKSYPEFFNDFKKLGGDWNVV